MKSQADYLRGGAGASAFLRIENPRAAPSIPPSQPARCMHGISPVSPRCFSHVDGINMGETPGRYRGDTAAIPWRHPSDTGPGVVSSAWRASRGPTHPDALGTPPCGALAAARTLSPWGASPRARITPQPAAQNEAPPLRQRAFMNWRWALANSGKRPCFSTKTCPQL
jgi:hypothetical protein